MSSPRVLVIDDERSIRELLESALATRGFEVRSAADGFRGLTAVREWNPAIIVLDVMMLAIDGISLVPMLRRITEAPIVMLSAKGESDAKVQGLEAGADDYLAKPFELSELDARLRAALRRPRLERHDILRFADLEIDLKTRLTRRGERRLTLSEREHALLATLVRNANCVLSREQLLDLVWGTERFVSSNAVETYISYLRAKVDLRSEAPLIHTVRGVGYVLRES